MATVTISVKTLIRNILIYLTFMGRLLDKPVQISKWPWMLDTLLYRQTHSQIPLRQRHHQRDLPRVQPRPHHHPSPGAQGHQNQRIQRPQRHADTHQHDG